MGVDAERWRRIEDLCHQAWNRPEYEREAFLAEACGDDHGLRQEVQELLAQQSSANRFLETPVDAVAAAVLPRPRASLTGRTLGTLEIGTLIGAGCMGEVYRATDTVLKRQVALKVLPSEVANDPERVARFQREAEVLAALNHPNIAHRSIRCQGSD